MTAIQLTAGTCLVATAILVGVYILITAAYRLFAHPLAHVPGPRLAGVSYWYECYYDVFRPAQYAFQIRALHQRYGPIIRITPDEVSIADPEFISSIYSPGQGQRRDKDINKVKALGINTSVGGAVSHELHRRRRDALEPFFSRRNISRLETRLLAKTEQLEQQFKTITEANAVVNLSDVYFAFSNDIVEEYCFSTTSNLLNDLQLAHVRRKNVDSVLRGVKINLQFPWIRSLIQKLPPGFRARFTPPGIRDMIRFRMGIRKEIQSILSDKSRGQPAISIFHELRDSPSLPDSEKSPQRLEDEATLLVMAGTQSTQLSLALAHYHLLANPAVMAQLRAELASRPSDTLAELEKLPYLSGVVQEAHRLSFGLTGRNPRVSPDQPIRYTDPSRASGRTYTLPPGTPVSTSTLLVHANEDVFGPDPWTFDPRRWLGAAGAEARRKKYQMAFSRGPRMCLGMHLANAEMAMAVAAMARWNMELFETGLDAVAFLHDYHIATPRLDSPGVRARVRGRCGR
ncbi:cytochrome P450 [Xylariaceae sp. FL0804]|nr:cytochrome P450 [Xylariaceae sp. FL0804]